MYYNADLVCANIMNVLSDDIFGNRCICWRTQTEVLPWQGHFNFMADHSLELAFVDGLGNKTSAKLWRIKDGVWEGSDGGGKTVTITRLKQVWHCALCDGWHKKEGPDVWSGPLIGTYFDC